MRKLKRTRKLRKQRKQRKYEKTRRLRKQKGGNLGAMNIPAAAVKVNPMNLDLYRGDDVKV